MTSPESPVAAIRPPQRGADHKVVAWRRTGWSDAIGISGRIRQNAHSELLQLGSRPSFESQATDMSTSIEEDPEWADARAIWAAGKVDIPVQRDADDIHLLSDLKFAAGMHTEATRVATADREREGTPEVGARLCSELIEFLSRIDEVTYNRLARIPGVAPDLLVEQTMLDLISLEIALRRMPDPPKVRKRKHEIDDPLILRLAEIFQRETGRRPTVTTDWHTDERRGDFVNFVSEFLRRMLPERSTEIGGRAIQRVLALARERDASDPEIIERDRK